ncbi:MAG: TatD family hydrolase [Limisphaerales bacterium]
MLYDAHNHLQDARLAPHLDAVLAALRREGVARMVVDGSCEQDWPAVAALARRCPEVIPSFGCHPWYVKERSPNWQQALIGCLDALPSAVGEIGLDHWIRDYDAEQQEAVFAWQLRLAADRNLPASIHCLQAWGRLLELLRAGPLPRCGFVLHSYGGPLEIIDPLAELGAYFSLPGYFANQRKTRQREAFLHVPPDRLLIETDAPDQFLPESLVQYPLADSRSGRALNHPANLAAVYRFAAGLFQEPLENLARRVEENFLRLFGVVGTR